MNFSQRMLVGGLEVFGDLLEVATLVVSFELEVGRCFFDVFFGGFERIEKMELTFFGFRIVFMNVLYDEEGFTNLKKAYKKKIVSVLCLDAPGGLKLLFVFVGFVSTL